MSKKDEVKADGAQDKAAKKSKPKAKATKKPKQGFVKTDSRMISLEHKFSQTECQLKAKHLADACKRKEELENQKKTFNSEIKAKIDGANAEISSLTHAVHTGKEYRQAKVDVFIDVQKSIKQFRQGKKVVKTEEMSDLDRQMSIQID